MRKTSSGMSALAEVEMPTTRQMATYEAFTARALLDTAKQRLASIDNASAYFAQMELAAARHLLEAAARAINKAGELLGEDACRTGMRTEG